jgi:AraC family transcriptional regulator
MAGEGRGSMDPRRKGCDSMLTYSLASNAARRVNFDEVYSRAFDDSRPGAGVKLLRSDGRFQNAAQPINGRARQLPDRKIADVNSHELEISPASVVSRRASAWDGIRVEIVECMTHDKVEFRFHAPSHLLLVYEEGVRDEGETIVGNLPVSTLRTLRRKLTFVPAGHAYRERQRPRVRSRVICFYFDPAKLPIHSDASRTAASLPPRLFFENNVLWDTAVKLAIAMEDGSDSERYCEALGVVVAHELLRMHGTVRRSLPARGGLAVWQQRTVAAYIDEHLAEAIPLDTLARLVHLSPFYFCRAFKQSFGSPPHRYHVKRRIDRAKALLADPASSVTDIALELGFSETSSFSAAFRHTTGTTPTEYRRALA